MNNLSLIDAVFSEKGFKSYFKDISTWSSWITFFKALEAPDSLNEGELKLFKDCTGLEKPYKGRIKEAYMICGRRSGKSTISALLAVFYSVFGNWRQYLSPGETARVFVVACNKEQAKIIMDYIKAFLNLTPTLKNMIHKTQAESIQLKNGVEINVKPQSWRSSRGFSTGILILEELSWWRFEGESKVQDKDIYTALLPGMTTITNSLVLGISTPFTRQGLLWQKYQAHHAKSGSILIWTAPTWVMNRNLTEASLKEQYLGDLTPEEFDAEYGAKFREDIESAIPEGLLARAIIKGQWEIPPEPGIEYFAFADASEGLRKGGDSFTYAIAHIKNNKIILDCVLEFRPPFIPSAVIEGMAEKLKKYGIKEIVQDRHSIAWIASDLDKFDIDVKSSDLTKSDIYNQFAVLLNKDLIQLLDNDRMRNQALGLQRFLKSQGAVRIDHLSGQHDDLINAAAGVCVLAGKRITAGGKGGTTTWVGKPKEPHKIRNMDEEERQRIQREYEDSWIVGSGSSQENYMSTQEFINTPWKKK